jgi:hypothetical protein
VTYTNFEAVTVCKINSSSIWKQRTNKI